MNINEVDVRNEYLIVPKRLKFAGLSKLGLIQERHNITCLTLLQDDVDEAVKQLLALKLEYKTLTGKDYQPQGGGGGGGGGGKKDKKNKEKKGKGDKGKDKKPPAAAAAGANPTVKKETRLGLEALKEENLSEWYSQVSR